MDTEKSSDLDENSKEDLYIKDIFADVKSKVDFISENDDSDNIVTELNAEVDLDDSVDVIDKSEVKIVEELGSEKEQIDESDKVGSTESLTDSVEQTKEVQAENKEMGNNLEGKEGVESSVDQNEDNMEDNINETVDPKSEEVTDLKQEQEYAENNNEKEDKSLEGGEVDSNEEDKKETEEVKADLTDGKIQPERSEDASISKAISSDTGVDKDIISENPSDNKVTEVENERHTDEIEEMEVEKDNLNKSDEITLEHDAPNKDLDLLSGNEDVIDKEKVNEFIREVINDLHGIVIETEECDAVVQDLSAEHTPEKNEPPKNEETDIETELELKIEDQVNTDEEFDFEENKNKENHICELKVQEDNLDNNETGEINETASSTGSMSDTDVVEASDKPVLFEDNTEPTEVEPEILQSEEKQKNLESTEEQTTEVEEKISEKKETDSERVQDVQIETHHAEIWKQNVVKMDPQSFGDIQMALHTSQRNLQEERSKHIREVMKLRSDLHRSQTELKQQKKKSEKQMTDVISHLMLLESRLRQEQLKVKAEVKKKDNLIEEQKKEILKLKDQNDQLLNAIKEICAKGGMNGYMRENQRKNGSLADGRDKKNYNGKLGSGKDKFLAKNRSSLELNTVNWEKYKIKNERLCSSQEDLRHLDDDQRKSASDGRKGLSSSQKYENSPRPISDTSEYANGNRKKHVRYATQNFFADAASPNNEMNKSQSESSHLSESTNSSSGVYSLSDHDLSVHDTSLTNGNHGNREYYEDEDDDRIFSFSSTHINTVIDEEEAMGPVMSHSGHMMSMGSMPMLANIKDHHRFGSGRNRPHSLSSVDIMNIEHDESLAKVDSRHSQSSFVSDVYTPPTSPSYIQNKTELTPFQNLKQMFRRKGSSKSKGHKKRSVSLSQTTNTEYSEALKKHFQKYDMS